MIPILYAPKKDDVSLAEYLAYIAESGNLGLGLLTDSISPVVIEERNGAFELEMKYPVTGALFGDIQTSSWIKATSCMGGSPQLFRVYKISKPIDGICEVNAEHISYMLNYAVCSPFVASGKNCAEVLALIKSNMCLASSYPFTLTVGTDKTSSASVNYELSEPENVRALLGGKEGSVLDVWGGEYEFDNLTVKLWNNRGHDNGVSIEYGKNLSDLKQEISDENIITAVVPYWRREYEDEEGNTISEYADRATASSNQMTAYITDPNAISVFPRLVYLNLSDEEKYQNRPPMYDAATPAAWSSTGLYSVGDRCSITESLNVRRFVCIQEVTEDDEEGNSHGKGISPTTSSGREYWEEYGEDEFKTEAEKYFATHNNAEPIVSLDVSFVDLSGTEEYKNILPLETVRLCDIVHVTYGDLGVQATLKVIKTEYNVLEDRYNQISLGSSRTNFASTIQEVEDVTIDTTEKNPKRYNVADGLNHLTQLLAMAYGGIRVEGDSWGFPGEVFFADNRDKRYAQQIMRINSNGIFTYLHGLNGGLESGWGIDGQATLNMLTAWVLNAERITTGFISADGTKNGNYWDLDTGEMRVAATAVNNIVEAYSSTKPYKAGDIVKYNNQQYICKAACTGQVPTNTNYWNIYAGGVSLYDLLMSSSESAASAQSTANTAASTASTAASSAATANQGVDWLKNYENAFNTLTNNGAIPGLALVTPQQATPQLPVGLYINASYIRSGVIDTALLKVNGVSLAGEVLDGITVVNVPIGTSPNLVDVKAFRFPYMVYVQVSVLADYAAIADGEYFTVTGMPAPRATLYNGAAIMGYVKTSSSSGTSTSEKNKALYIYKVGGSDYVFFDFQGGIGQNNEGIYAGFYITS